MPCLETTHLPLTLAGYWYAFVSVPFFNSFCCGGTCGSRSGSGFLWQVSRLNLHLTAAHPDRAGGIRFLGNSSYAFSPILFAEGASLSGLIAAGCLYEGRSLLSFKMEAAGLSGFFVLLIVGPLVMFIPRLTLTRRQGSAEYGLLANRYVFGFEDKWIRSGKP